jgi:hypothetical protein
MDRAKDRAMADAPLTPIEVGLTAAIVAVEAEEPRILVAGDPKSDTRAGLPFGPFDPLSHRTFEIGLRSWVAAQTGINVGYVEQLYTFGDRGRHARPGDVGSHMISVGYLALTRISETAAPAAAGASFEPWYRFFPWEDWRDRKPAILDQTIVPLLEQWAKSGKAEPTRPLARRERLRHCFGVGGSPWDEEKVLDRYELLYEAGLVEEARRDGRDTPRAKIPPLGEPMRFDHRRILATAIARLRAKLKYRPVVFELMPDQFTLTELQRTVEAISGRHLHKQNFRRLVESAALVEPTGETSTATGGPRNSTSVARWCRSGPRPDCGWADGPRRSELSGYLSRPSLRSLWAARPRASTGRLGCLELSAGVRAHGFLRLHRASATGVSDHRDRRAGQDNQRERPAARPGSPPREA